MQRNQESDLQKLEAGDASEETVEVSGSAQELAAAGAQGEQEEDLSKFRGEIAFLVREFDLTEEQAERELRKDTKLPLADIVERVMLSPHVAQH